MKLTFVCHEYPPTGAGGADALKSLTQVLSQSGVTLQIITIGLGNQITFDSENFNLKTIRLGAGRHSITEPSILELIRSYFLLKFRSVKWIRSFQPDAIIAYFAFPAGHALLQTAKQMKLPFIVYLRGSDVPGHKVKRWRIFNKVRVFFAKPVWKNADLLLANGTHLKQLAQDFSATKEIINLPNGVDTILYCPKLGRSPSNELKLLFIGRLIESKRCLELVEAIHFLSRTRTDLELTIVGDGPLRDRILRYSRDLGVRKQVRLMGHVPKEEMSSIYQNHDILLHLSEAEGLSNVLMEALSSGMAVIGCPTSVDGILDDKIYYSIHNPTPSSIAGAIEYLIENPAYTTQLRIKARSTVEKMSWHSTADLFKKYINNLLERESA